MKYNRLDHGWAWVIAVACFGCNLSVSLLEGVYGLFIDHWCREFKASVALISLGPSINQAVFLIIASPICTLVMKKTGPRPLAMLCGITLPMCILGLAFARSIYQYLIYMCLMGLAMGLGYPSNYRMMMKYFDKRLSIAAGISASGSKIGLLIVPILTTVLMEKYSWRGTLIILAGVTMHQILCGAVLIPIQLKEDTDTTGSNSAQDRERKLSSRFGSDRSISNVSHWSRLSSVITMIGRSKLDIDRRDRWVVQATEGMYELQPSYEFEARQLRILHNRQLSESLPNLFLTSSPSTKIGFKPPLRRHMSDIDTRRSSIEDGLLNTSRDEKNTTIDLEFMKRSSSGDASEGLFNSGMLMSSLGPPAQNIFPLQAKLMFDKDNDIFDIENENSDLWGIGTGFDDDTNSEIFSKNELEENIGDSSSLRDYTTRDADPGVKLVPSKKHPHKNITFKREESIYNMQFFTFAIVMTILRFTSMLNSIYLVPSALQSGLSVTESALMMSILGFVSAITCPIAGFIGNLPFIQRRHIFTAAMFVEGVILIVRPFITDFLETAVVAGIIGCCYSLLTTMMYPVLNDIVHGKHISTALGIVLLFQGIGYISGPPIAGLIYEAMNSYRVPYVVAGSVYLLGTTLMLLIHVLNKIKKS